MAGVRRDEVRVEGGHPRRVGKPRHLDASMGGDALCALDDVESRADAMGIVVGPAGRELRHHHARDRALRLPHRRQQQQPVRHAVPAGRIGPVGHHGPRVVQRTWRAAPAVGRAGHRGRGDARRVHAPQPHALRVRAGRAGAEAESERPGRFGARGRNHHRARGRTGAGRARRRERRARRRRGPRRGSARWVAMSRRIGRRRAT